MRFSTYMTKGSFPSSQKTTYKLSARTFIQSQYLKALAASLRVGFCDEWKRGLTIVLVIFRSGSAGDCRNSIWQNLNCPWYSSCRLHNGFPRCVCATEQCPMMYEPLCATDGRTYRNTCHMRQAGCRKRKLLRLRNPGHCREYMSD